MVPDRQIPHRRLVETGEDVGEAAQALQNAPKRYPISQKVGENLAKTLQGISDFFTSAKTKDFKLRLRSNNIEYDDVPKLYEDYQLAQVRDSRARTELADVNSQLEGASTRQNLPRNLRERRERLRERKQTLEQEIAENQKLLENAPAIKYLHNQQRVKGRLLKLAAVYTAGRLFADEFDASLDSPEGVENAAKALVKLFEEVALAS